MSSDVVVSKSLKSKLLKGWVCLPSTQAEAPAIEASDKWFERSSRHSKVNSWQSLTKKMKTLSDIKCAQYLKSAN